MPVRVTVELPGEKLQVYIRNTGPDSAHEGHDPGGRRIYEWEAHGHHGVVDHKRKDGWPALVQAVMTDIERRRVFPVRI